MDILWIRVISQAGVYITFLLYLLWAVKRGAKEWVPLLGAVFYAIVFEHFNMLRYAHSQGGYHYNSYSWLWVWGDVPLYIPLAWGFILATSRALTDHLHLKPWARPFSDALLALLIDISMDAVAIRLKFWYWHGVGLNQAFFGVPADNFVGWLLVSFTFCVLTRWLWSSPSPLLRINTLDPKRLPAAAALAQISLVPPIAYLAYLGLEATIHFQYRLFHAQNLTGQLYVLAGTLALLCFIVVAGMRPSRRVIKEAAGGVPASQVSAAMLHVPRHIFHLFGLCGLLCLPAADRLPALWLLAGGVWALEWGIALLARNRKSGLMVERLEKGTQFVH